MKSIQSGVEANAGFGHDHAGQAQQRKTMIKLFKQALGPQVRADLQRLIRSQWRGKLVNRRLSSANRYRRDTILLLVPVPVTTNRMVPLSSAGYAAEGVAEGLVAAWP